MRNRREIEEKVTALLEAHGIYDAPVPVDQIARNEGLRIVSSPFGGDVSGALLRSDGMSGIAVNASHHLVRRRFTIAHELAHFILNHSPDEDHLDWEFTVLRRDDRSSEGTDYREIEANAFAANLLMPKEFLKRDVERFLNFNGVLEITDQQRQDLAKRYKVSDIAMTYRLANLNFVRPF